MAKPQKQEGERSDQTKPELRPDGWERFGKAVDAAMKHKTIKIKPSSVDSTSGNDLVNKGFRPNKT